MLHGLRAAFKIIFNYLKPPRRWDTVTLIVSHWAPASENNTQAYINSVCRKAGLSPDLKISRLDRNVLCRLVWAMAFVECGVEISFGLVENAYALALRS